MKRLIAAAALAAFALAPLSGFAGQDESQRMLMQRLQVQKMKLAAVEKVQGAERDKLMQEYMTTMQETMSLMQTAKPSSGTTLQEQRDWIEEQQKLIQQVMEQLMAEHQLLMRAR